MAVFLKKLLLRSFQIHFLQYLYILIQTDSSDEFSLFLDFLKALDCVKHEILLSEFNTYGI